MKTLMKTALVCMMISLIVLGLGIFATIVTIPFGDTTFTSFMFGLTMIGTFGLIGIAMVLGGLYMILDIIFD